MLKIRDVVNFLLLLPLLLIVLLHTDLGSFLVKMQLEKELSTRTQAKIEIGKFDFTWPLQLRFDDVVAEKEGIGKIDVKKVVVDTSLTSLISGNFTTATILLESLHALEYEVTKLNIEIAFDAQKTIWNYTLLGEAQDANQFKANGLLSQLADNYFLEVAACIIGNDDFNIALQNPLKVRFDNNQLTMNPARFSAGPLFVDFNLKGNSETFKASLDWRIPSLDIFPMPIQHSSWTGECAVNLLASGKWSSPIIQGGGTIRQGTYEHLKHGISFKNVNADFKIDADGVRLTSFDAKDALGSLKAAGHLKFDKEFLFPFEVNANFDNTTVVKLEHVDCRISGNVLFQGNKLGASLGGDIVLDHVDFFLMDGKSSTTHDFEITYINQPIETYSRAPSTRPSLDWPIQLNLHLIGKGITISDQQLNSKWKGDISIIGTAEQLALQGDCRLLQGDYLFNGKKFNLTQGTITFNGDPKKKTQLYVVGQQEIESIMAEVILKGPLNDLSLSFRSNPQLSEKEILCRLLFGRGTSEITPFQGTELTESINKLKNQGGSEPNFVSNLKSRIGLDRIDISHGKGAESEEISLQVGKYLTPGVFIGVKKGITTDANRIGIEADLKRNVKLQAEYGDDSEGHFHLKWKRDY